MKSAYLCLIILLAIAGLSYADIIHVPGDYTTIQEGIDAASDGDTVLVAAGTYSGDGNKDLDFRGKAITVTSKDGADYCIIECQGDGRGFYFHNGEGETSVVSGFTIRNGSTSNRNPEHGGGIYCRDSSPTIMNNIIVRNKTGDRGGGIWCINSSSVIADNIIENNGADYGGGIYCSQSSATIQSNTIRGNHARLGGGGIHCSGYPSPVITNNIIVENHTDEQRGGGIYCGSSSPYITNNTIVGNQAVMNGGGICCSGSYPRIANNTIIGNLADDNGGGISCEGYADPTITNTILWNDNPLEIYLSVNGSITITYSDIRGGWEGVGNINTDPMFVDPDNGDYHLNDNSPCISVGIMTPDVPGTDIEGNPRPNPTGSNPDMGAYENSQGTPLFEPSVLEKVSGDNQSGDVGNVLPNPLVVRVLDQNTDPVEGVTVNFESSEGASVNPTQATTDENGQAQTILTLGAQPGEYSVTTSVESLDPVVFTVTAIGVPVLIVDAGEDKTICHPNNGGETQIGGNPTASDGTPPYSYSWTPADSLDNSTTANPIAGPTATTTYTVTVTDSGEPPQEVSDSVTVTVYPELVADAGEDKNIAPGGSTQIGGNPTASGGTAPYIYSWIPIESLDDATIANPTASPNETTTYTVAVTDDNGCEDTDEIKVTVVEGLYAAITYPVEGAYIRGEIIITGTVLGGQNGLKSWILKRTKIGGQYKTISYGDTEVDNGELGSWDTTAGAEGQHMLRLTAVDNADNERVHEITVNVDNTDPAPVIELQSDGASGDWTKDYTDLYVSGEVEAGAQLIEAYLIFEGGLPFTDDVKEHIGIDGTGRIAGTIPDGYNLSGNEITTVTLHLKCKDRAGNEGEGTSNTLHVDNDKPTVTIQNPVSDANFNLFNKDILIAGIADDIFGISRVEINIYDGSGWILVDGTTNWQHHYFQNNEVAVVTVHARSIDNAGNASEIAERKFHCIWDFPSVNLSFPVDDSVVSGVVGITGLVVDSDVDDSDLHWSVDYGIGEHKINNIASGYGNKNGVLCNWATRTLDTGQLYTLFLTVTSSSTMASARSHLGEAIPSIGAEHRGIHRFDDYYVSSAGELVVKRYNINVVEPSIIYGDVNDDGKVTPLDAALVMQHVVGELTLNSNQQLRADVTGNGTLSNMDAALILQKITGLIVEFPVR